MTLPIYATPRVHRDHHVEVARSLYSVPGSLIGQRVEARADKALVRIFHQGQLVKVHPRQAPGRRSTDPDDLPSEKTAYALRDLDRLRRMATGDGPAIGAAPLTRASVSSADVDDPERLQSVMPMASGVSTRPGPACSMASSYGGPAAGRMHATTCGSPSTFSSDSAPRRGRSERGPNCVRPKRRPEGGNRAPSPS